MATSDPKKIIMHVRGRIHRFNTVGGILKRQSMPPKGPKPRKYRLREVYRDGQKIIWTV